MKKVIGIIIAVVVVALAVFCYFRFYFVFGEGVRSGELNYVVHKGVIWKTYEGRLIMTGFRGSKHIDGWTLPCPWVKELWEK